MPILNGKYRVPSQRRVLPACPNERTASIPNSTPPSLLSLPNDKAASFDLNDNVPSFRSERHVSLSSQQGQPPRHSGPFLWEGAILVFSVTSPSRTLLAPARTGTPLVSCLRPGRFVHSFGSINTPVVDSVVRRRQSSPGNIKKTNQQRIPRVCSQGVRHPSLHIRSQPNPALPSLLRNFASRLNSGTKR